MNIAFTLCSNNYLAHAKTLVDSFLEFHTDFEFVIGLVDKYSDDYDYTLFENAKIIPVEELQIVNFNNLVQKYNITELNTSVKPGYFHYLFQKFNAQKVIYIDPDILVKSRFEEVISILDTKNIVITPHILSPVDDEFAPTDYHTIRGGVFNLGFIALSNYHSNINFLNWWHDRVIKYGYNDFSRNMFFDQLWINYVPCFYDNYCILKHPGYNMANWNLHERTIFMSEDKVVKVNGNFALRFFHFSSYHYNKPDIICSYLTRYNFNSRPDLVQLFEEYRSLLIKNDVEKIKLLPVYYYPLLQKKSLEISNTKFNKPIYRRVYNRVKKSIKFLVLGNG